MNSSLRNTLQLAGAALLFCSAAAYAQIAATPYLSSEGVAKAQQIAADSLHTQVADLALTAIVSTDLSMMDTAGSGLGSLPFTLEKFNVDNGTASLWAYAFYSTSKAVPGTAMVIKLPLLGLQGYGSVDEPEPGMPTAPLNLGASYAGSDKMAERVRADATYQSYHTAHPDEDPLVVVLRNAQAEDMEMLPSSGFAADEPFWTLSFGTLMEEPTMTCFVSAVTGATECRMVEIPSSVKENAAAARAAMTVTPTPSTGRTRVEIALPSGAGIRSLNDVSVELYDASGRKVLDLTESFKANALQYAEFDASRLPAGIYFCRAGGAAWHGMTGVVVGK